jgi:WD40 repeat protein
MSAFTFSAAVRVALVAALGLAIPCRAGEPSSAPILRVESEMHGALIRRLVFDPVHRRLITAGDDKTLRVWRLPHGRLERVLRPPIGPGYEGRIYALAVSPDGNTLAAGGWTGWDWDAEGSVYLFDARSGELIRRVAGFPDVIGSLAYSKDGRQLAVGLHADGGLWLLRTSDYAPVARDEAYRDKILGTDFDREGRLAVVALDGYVRLYDRDLKLAGRLRTAPGRKPLTVRFSPDGRLLALSFHDAVAPAVLNAADLSLAFTPDTSGLRGLAAVTDVAWSDDGATLFACGEFTAPDRAAIFRWGARGRGALEELPVAARLRIADLQPLPGGGLAFAAEDPALGVLDAAGRQVLARGPQVLHFGHHDGTLKVSADGARVQFALGPGEARPVRFSLAARELRHGAGSELSGAATSSPSFAFAEWRNEARPVINGARLQLDDYEVGRAYAVSPDDSSLVLGTEWALRAYDRNAKPRWKVAAPAVVRNVVVTPRGDVAVASLSDGTIRWYRMEDGVEFLALFVNPSDEEWIAWTPAGYYASSTGGDNYIGWHLNRGKNIAGDFYRAIQFERILYRPDLVDDAFRSRGRPASGPSRRAQPRFDILQLASIAPPRVRVEMTGPPRRGEDGRMRGTLRIAARATALPMLDYTVFVNGIPVTAATHRELSSARRTEFATDASVALRPGENRVRVEISTGTSLAVAETHVDVDAPQGAEPPPGNLYVLAVGVNEFPDLARDASLKFAARDAQEVARFFGREGPRHFRKVFVRALSDLDESKPDRSRIVDALGLLADAGADDTVIVFLASHGVSDAAGNYYFLPRNARGDDVAATTGGVNAEAPSLLRWDALAAALRRTAGRRILIVDTCHARSIEGRADLLSLAKRSAASRFALVVASQAHEESQEYPPARHGLFTHALLEGLRGAGDANADGLITVEETFRHALPLVERLRDAAIGTQTPQLVAPEPLGQAVIGRVLAARPGG